MVSHPRQQRDTYPVERNGFAVSQPDNAEGCNCGAHAAMMSGIAGSGCGGGSGGLRVPIRFVSSSCLFGNLHAQSRISCPLTHTPRTGAGAAIAASRFVPAAFQGVTLRVPAEGGGSPRAPRDRQRRQPLTLLLPLRRATWRWRPREGRALGEEKSDAETYVRTYVLYSV